jgi:hypothetical protein
MYQRAGRVLKANGRGLIIYRPETTNESRDRIGFLSGIALNDLNNGAADDSCVRELANCRKLLWR